MWHWSVDNPKAIIVLVHGAGEHHGRYEWTISQFNKAGFYVIAGDLPGQGNNYKIKGHIKSFNEYIETIESWVEEAKKVGGPVFIFGHSMGGLAAIRTVMEKELNIKALLLSSPCLGLAKPPVLPLHLLTKVLNIITPSLRVPSGIRSDAGTRNETVLEKDKNDELRVKNVSIRWYRQLVEAMRLANKKIDQFPNIPILVMQAGDDLIVDSKTVESWFNHVPVKDKTYKEWPELYHEVLNEPERDTVFRYLVKYIELYL